MNKLCMVRSHWNTWKAESRIWDDQKPGLEKCFWLQPDRRNYNRKNKSRGFHQEVAVTVRGFTEEIGRKKPITELFVCKTNPVSGWQRTLGRWYGEEMKRGLSAWANGILVTVFQIKFRRRNYGYVACERLEHIQDILRGNDEKLVRNGNLKFWREVRPEDGDFGVYPLHSCDLLVRLESWEGVMWEWAQES